MKAYKLYAAAVSVWNYLRGEPSRDPTYVVGAAKRVRRSPRNLGESFPFGWKEMERGEYANALLVYAATIGEFHPLKPVIDSYLERRPGTPLVILSGQTQYIEALRAAYPHAAVGTPPPSAPWLYDQLFNMIRPRILALGEGPCLHLHFPIPFDLALPAACVRHSTPMVVVNATLHRYLVSSRLDYIEGRLFGSIYRDALRYWYTPNDIFKSWLLKAGVPSDRIIVTGDLRFDALRGLGERSSEFADLLKYLGSISDPKIVAGSINAIDEEGPVIDGWIELRKKYPGSRLIMAPRHVNNRDNMRQLYDYLDSKGVRYAKRSEGMERTKEADAIVVDVFGELPHYYSIASVAYIGRNHGVLEPLRFRVPTVVAPRRDWRADYVTFPYYKQMIDENGIIEAPDKAELGQIFLKIIDAPDYGKAYVSNALRVAASQKGAAKRIVEHLESFVP
jgi:3-deoxy-D-manno-octulosonic-acid transferase